MLQPLDQAHFSGKLYMPTSLLYFAYPQNLKVVKTLTGDIWGWNPTDLPCHVGWMHLSKSECTLLLRSHPSQNLISTRWNSVFCCCSKAAQSEWARKAGRWTPQWVRTERQDENTQGGREVSSGSVLSLPVRSQGEWQPMHRRMNGGALLRSLSDCKQAIIKSPWWQSSVLKGTNKNKYIKHNKSQGPVVETYYPWGITGLFSSGLSAIGFWFISHCFNTASITLHTMKSLLFLCTSG